MTTTPSAFKRVFIGKDDTYATQTDDGDLLTIAGDGDFVFKGNFNGTASTAETRLTYSDSAVTGELNLVNTLSGANTLSVRNLSATGYSAYVARDNAGVERMAIGVGGSGTPQADVVYWEASYFTGASHSTPPPTIKIQQTGYMFGSYGQRNRMLFTNTGLVHLIKDDGNAGFVFDSTTSALALKSPLSTAIANTVLDVWGAGVFGDTQASRTNAAPSGASNPALGINHSTGVFLKAIYPLVGTVVMQMTGNTSTRALEFVNSDNSNVVVMSLRLDGSGQVTFGGPIIASSAVALTAAGSAQGDALALTKAKNVVTTTAAGTGVRLPTAIAGMTVTVFNRGANTLNVYPATGAAINAIATNNPKTVATTASETFTASSATQWYTET